MIHVKLLNFSSSFFFYIVSAKHHGVINDTFTVGERIQQFCTNMPFPVEKLLKVGLFMQASDLIRMTFLSVSSICVYM